MAIAIALLRHSFMPTAYNLSREALVDAEGSAKGKYVSSLRLLSKLEVGAGFEPGRKVFAVQRRLGRISR